MSSRCCPTPAQIGFQLSILLGDGFPVLHIAGSVTETLGFGAEDFRAGRVSLRDRVHPEDQDVVEALFAANPTDSDLTANLRLRRANGSICCAKVTYRRGVQQEGLVLQLLIQDAKHLPRTMEPTTAMPSFRVIMENTDDYIYFKDRNHVFTGASQTLVSLCAPAEHWTDLLGKTDYDVFPEHYADIYYRLEKEIFAGKPVAHETQATLAKDGREGWVDNRKYPIRNDRGEIIGLYGIARDITEQVRAEVALRRERDWMRNLLEIVEAIIVTLDVEGKITLINRKGDEILGYAPGELEGRDWLETCVPEGREREDLRSAFAQLLSGESSTKAQLVSAVLTRDGRRREVVWHNSVIRGEGGAIKGVLAAGQDITEQQELLERIEKLAAHVPGLLFQYQQWPDGRASVPYASRGIRDVFGVTPAEVVDDATALLEALHPEDLPEIMAAVEVSARDLTPWRSTHRSRLPDGRTLWLEGESSPERQADGSVLWHGYIRDVTAQKRSEKEHRHLQDMLARTEKLSHLGSWDWEPDTDKVTWSAEMFRIFQVDPAEGAPPFAEHGQFLAPGEIERLGKVVDVCLRDGEPYAMELKVVRRDGTSRICMVHGYPETGPDHRVHYVYGSVQDITEVKRAEAQLRQAASVFEHSLEGIIITDAKNRILDTNPSFSRITGYSKEEVLGKDPRLLASGQQGADFYAEMWRALSQQGSWRGEIWNRRKNGEVYPELLSISIIRDADGVVQNYIAVFSDISQAKAHEAELNRSAHYDDLTGLPNRRLLADRIGQAVAHARRTGKRLAVCYLDLDGFKPINDLYGHATGDRVLVQIAGVLKRIVRAEDTVSRLGGDEFVLLFSDLGAGGYFRSQFDRILAVVAEPIVIDDRPHQVSASIGVTLCPPDAPDADTLLRHADQAMYRAKESGKNCYHFYDPEQDHVLQSRQRRLRRIRSALPNGELVLHYQPAVDLASGEILGVEALIRWDHPTDGLLSPGSFLPDIKDSELEVQVGEMVVETALQQLGAWRGLGLHLPISVNISPHHLLQPNFANQLAAALKSHADVDAGDLTLEILESAALSDVERAAETLATCRDLGVKIALDDFGTGYASLTYFRTLPVDMLKIDQSFVRDILDDPNDKQIVESLVTLSKAFGRGVTAEGVETLDHAALLVRLGCRRGQGYGIALPMPAHAVPDWVASWELHPRVAVDRDC